MKSRHNVGVAEIHCGGIIQSSNHIDNRDVAVDCQKGKMRDKSYARVVPQWPLKTKA